MRRSVLVVGVLGVFALAEIALLVWVSGRIGVGWTLLALLATAALGGVLWRREGARALESLRSSEADAQAVGRRVTDTVLIFVGGLLLLLPGFLTDLIGLVCLLPFTRPLARRGVQTALAAFTRPYRDQADLWDARLRRDTVVEGQVADEPTRPGSTPRPDESGGGDPRVIRGEIVP